MTAKPTPPRRKGGSYIKDKRTGALTPNPAEAKTTPAAAPAEATATPTPGQE